MKQYFYFARISNWSKNNTSSYAKTSFAYGRIRTNSERSVNNFLVVEMQYINNKDLNKFINNVLNVYNFFRNELFRNI